jgi:hypothetical protein
MSTFNKILQYAARKMADHEKQKETHATQQKLQVDWGKYKEDNWRIALMLMEAVTEYPTAYKVQTPSSLVLLVPKNHTPKDLNEFAFELWRLSSNDPNSDSAVLPREVEMLLTDYLSKCGFKGFKVECTQDTYKYYIKIRRLDGFCMGKPLTPGLGEIVFTQQTKMCGMYGVYNRLGVYGTYEIALFNGGSSGWFLPNSVLWIYQGGLWHKSGIDYDDNCCPYLKNIGKYLDDVVGCIARLD